MIIFHNFEHSSLLTSITKQIKIYCAMQYHVALLSFHAIEILATPSPAQKIVERDSNRQKY